MNLNQEYVVREMESDVEAMQTIINVICLLVVSLCRDEKEWESWGKPFIRLVHESQINFMRKSSNCTIIEFQLAEYCVVKNMGLTFKSTEDSDDYIVVDEVSSQLKRYCESDLLIDERVQRLMPQYLQNFTDHVVNSNSYDARTRTLCQHFCELFEVSYLKLQSESVIGTTTPLSTAISSDMNIATPPSTGSAASSKYITEGALTTQHRQAVIASYRLWRVGAAAAVGGALLAATVQLTAPTIVASLLSMLSSSTSFGQFLVSLTTLMTMELEGLGVIGTVGATLAGHRMLKRTDPISEFYIEPLHYPVTHLKASGLLSGEFVVVDHVQDSATNVPRSVSNNISDPIRTDEPIQQAVGMLAEHFHTSLAPVYIVVPGQVDAAIDERVKWGAATVAGGIQSSTINARQVHEAFQDHFSSGPTSVAVNIESHLSTPDAVDPARQDSNDMDIFNGANCDGSMREISSSATPEIGQLESADQIKDDVSSKDNNSDDYNALSSSSITILSEFGSHSWQCLDASHLDGWWRKLFPEGDPFLLLWATNEVASFTKDLNSFAATQVRDILINEVMKVSPVSALYLPKIGLDKLLDINNPWDVVMDRARQAGQLLAHSILENSISRSSSTNISSSNQRPISLIGYGMGARVVFECLLEIARLNELPKIKSDLNSSLRDDSLSRLHGHGQGLIENVVLLGAPVGFGMGFASGIDIALNGHLPRWKQARQIVSGRFVNCYSTRDWILYARYRLKSLDVSVAGLAPVVFPSVSNNGNNDSTISRNKTSTAAGIADVKGFERINHWALADYVQNIVDKDRLYQMTHSNQIENVDVTEAISNLLDYPHNLEYILEALGLET